MSTKGRNGDMADPITLTVVGTVVLTEGIKFLYSQTGEVLKRWRERKEAKKDAPHTQIEPVEVVLPEAFEGQLVDPKINFDTVAKLEDNLRQLRQALGEYADEIEPVDPQNIALLQTVDALRRAFEAIFQDRLTFKGEQRSSTGPLIEGHIDVDEVAGYVAGVRAQMIHNGRIVGKVNAKRVGPGGQVVAVDLTSGK